MPLRDAEKIKGKRNSVQESFDQLTDELKDMSLPMYRRDAKAMLRSVLKVELDTLNWVLKEKINHEN
ncbi:MAG: hypothetical protein ACYSR0_00450 [Planctomycetota bacterium]|jgi:hypothetical protein